MTVGRITKRSVEAIALPARTARSYLWDDTLKGFGCMVMASGARSYLVQYQMGGRAAPTRRATIGRHGSPWTAERARDRASDLLEMVRKGIDPAEHAKTERAATEAGKALAERLAFSAYVDLFSRKYLDAKNLRSAEDIKATFRRDLTPAFKDRPINTLRRAEIATRLDDISERSKSAAVKAHKWLRKLLSWAVERGDLATSPMESMGPPHLDGRRKRVLRGDELRAVWMASDELGEPFGSFVKMLALTGQRLREVAGASWSEIDIDKAEWTIPGERCKNGRDHLCPLSPQVVELLERRFPAKSDRKGLLFTTTGQTPISGFSKSKSRLDAVVVKALATFDNDELPMIQPWVFHDIRRSFSTGCQALGFPIEHTESCLNHVSGKRGGLAAIYQLHEYKPEKVAVMAAWGRHVEALLIGQKSNVLSLVSTSG
jgi:integrase